jgi:hypothetical protein
MKHRLKKTGIRDITATDATRSITRVKINYETENVMKRIWRNSDLYLGIRDITVTDGNRSITRVKINYETESVMQRIWRNSDFYLDIRITKTEGA